MTSSDSAKADATVLAETWTSLVGDIHSALTVLIGCWGSPGNKLMEESLRGSPEGLSKEVLLLFSATVLSSRAFF